MCVCGCTVEEGDRATAGELTCKPRGKTAIEREERDRWIFHWICIENESPPPTHSIRTRQHSMRIRRPSPNTMRRTAGLDSGGRENRVQLCSPLTCLNMMYG
ncbi:hypothetical protein CAOG_009725 [Capsaspora owczarzaki ATCC 30864]|uniref:Uncharacterized protein n=1 Tax=Capsaspora owczarzaki (strain ATCC 30864) TaxID=595528 RepID=A0A0D2VQS1_CAPO3|nr:hypothetical protein CAOG_009725 [Capsaspora owczarzaki ATCC 30864]